MTVIVAMYTSALIGKGKKMSDYIKRENATEVYSKLYWMHEGLLNFQEELGKVYDEILNIPSADVAPVRHGRWIEGPMCIECSCCGELFNDEIVYMHDPFGKPRYCPCCGSRMDGGGDDE